MPIEEYLKKIAKDVREHYSGAYLNICFTDDSIMITNCEDIKLNSMDCGDSWYKIGENND